MTIKWRKKRELAKEGLRLKARYIHFLSQECLELVLLGKHDKEEMVEDTGEMR